MELELGRTSTLRLQATRRQNAADHGAISKAEAETPYADGWLAPITEDGPLLTMGEEPGNVSPER